MRDMFKQFNYCKRYKAQHFIHFFSINFINAVHRQLFTTFRTLSTSHSATIWRTASTNNKNIRKLMLRIWLLGTTRAFLHYRLRPLEMKNGSQLRLQSASVYDVTWLIVRKKKMPCHYWRSDVEEDQWKAPLSMKIKNEIICFWPLFTCNVLDNRFTVWLILTT